MPLVEQLHGADVPPPNNEAGTSPLYTKVMSYVDPDTGIASGQQRLVKLYNGTGGALALGTVCMVNWDGDEETTPTAIALATATPPRDVVVAAEAIADVTYGWFVQEGWVEALVEGTTDVAKDDFLKCTSGTSTTAFIKDGTTITAASAAIAAEAQAANSAVLTKVFLMGGESTIA